MFLVFFFCRVILHPLHCDMFSIGKGFGYFCSFVVSCWKGLIVDWEFPETNLCTGALPVLLEKHLVS